MSIQCNRFAWDESLPVFEAMEPRLLLSGGTPGEVLLPGLQEGDGKRRNRGMGVSPMSPIGLRRIPPLVFAVGAPLHGRDPPQADATHGQDARATHGRDARATIEAARGRGEPDA